MLSCCLESAIFCGIELRRLSGGTQTFFRVWPRKATSVAVVYLCLTSLILPYFPRSNGILKPIWLCSATTTRDTSVALRRMARHLDMYQINILNMALFYCQKPSILLVWLEAVTPFLRTPVQRLWHAAIAWLPKRWPRYFKSCSAQCQGFSYFEFLAHKLRCFQGHRYALTHQSTKSTWRECSLWHQWLQLSNMQFW